MMPDYLYSQLLCDFFFFTATMWLLKKHAISLFLANKRTQFLVLIFGFPNKIKTLPKTTDDETSFDIWYDVLSIY